MQRCRASEPSVLQRVEDLLDAPQSDVLAEPGFLRNDMFAQALSFRKPAGQRCEGGEDFKVAASYYNAGLAAASLHDCAKAKTCFAEALRIQHNDPTTPPLHKAATLNAMGEVMIAAGTPDDAQRCLEEALTLLRSGVGEEHPDVADVYVNLTVAATSSGKKDTALSYCERALNIRRACLGEGHPKVGESYNRLAWLHEDRGDHKNAIECLRSALQVRMVVPGEDDVSLGDMHQRVAASLVSQGNNQEALSHYEEAQRIFTKSQGDSLRVADVAFSIAAVYARQNAHVPAIANYEMALRIRTKCLTEKHPKVAAACDALGCEHEAAGDAAQALEFYTKALDLRVASLNYQDVLIGDSHARLGAYLYKADSDYEEAWEHLKASYEISQKKRGENDAETLRVKALMDEALKASISALKTSVCDGGDIQL
eukprot:NODE_9270_length_1436_cov_2.304049.p1 GENE.NODE_9270_length_1436_cov_2.304049~~NODE_9270_length_1436_cov_2.304049.p1  ORF type:complete len:427 (+),score=127.37 NODE_9270_length_1436_cov_2.304049:3-1283(+)